jgi:hypothetical protein
MIAVTPAMCLSMNGAHVIWWNGVWITACQDRAIARRLAALIEVYGLVDAPDYVDDMPW